MAGQIKYSFQKSLRCSYNVLTDLTQIQALKGKVNVCSFSGLKFPTYFILLRVKNILEIVKTHFLKLPLIIQISIQILYFPAGITRGTFPETRQLLCYTFKGMMRFKNLWRLHGSIPNISFKVCNGIYNLVKIR